MALDDKLTKILKFVGGAIDRALILYVGFCIGYSFVRSKTVELNPEREQRIVEFYQKHGPLTQNATPAYLDLRAQLWQREVEGE